MGEEKNYECKRCGFATVYKSSLLTHLRRKSGCLPVLEDIDRATLLEPYQSAYESKAYICTHCNKRFSHKNNMYTHRKTCEARPTPAPSIQAASEPIAPHHKSGADRKEPYAGYIYLVRKREHVRLKEDVYKHGKTTIRHPTVVIPRLQSYDKGSEVCYLHKVKLDDVDGIEATITAKFKTMFTRHMDGREYFCGDCDKMILEIQKIIRDYYKQEEVVV